jgi:membrane fusion protein (multidrug efflux system)
MTVARDTDSVADPESAADAKVRDRRPEDGRDELQRPAARTKGERPDREPAAPSAQEAGSSEGALAESENRGRPFYKRPLPIALIVLVALGLIIGGTLYWLHARQYVSTDDAFIDANVVRLAPRVAGQVLQVPVRDNQEVQKGQLVVEIDPAPFQVRLDQAKAAKAEAKGRLAQARSQLAVTRADAEQALAQVGVAQADSTNASDNFDRLQHLHAASRNLAVSERDVEDARAQARSASARLIAAQKQAAAAAAQVDAASKQVDTAEAAVASAAATVEQAQLELSYTRVIAPVSGRITHRGVDVGDYVEVGQALLALVPDLVWVTANFKETQLAHMRPGQPVTITIDAYPGHEFQGHVDSIQAGTGARFSLLPPQNATGNYVKVVQRVPVKITFDKLPKDLLLAPGMSVEPDVKVQ